MKFKEKLLAIQVPAVKTAKREAEKLFASGVKNERELIGHLGKAKESLVNASLDFYEARFAFGHGEWEAHCALYKDKISIRTIQRRIADAEMIIKYVIFKDKPDVISMREIRQKALGMELPSVREMVQTMRDNGVAIEFGQYYPEDYEKKKQARLLGDGQIEFDFQIAEQALQMFCNPKVVLPAQLEKAEELAGTLKSAQLRAERHLRELKAKESK